MSNVALYLALALALLMFGFPDCFGQLGGFQAHTGPAKTQCLGSLLHIFVVGHIVRALDLGWLAPIGVLIGPIRVEPRLLEIVRMDCRPLENALLFSRYQGRQDFQLGPVHLHRNLVGLRQVV